MLSYQRENLYNPAPLENIRAGGKISEQAETFFYERARSDYAKNVIYQETEDQFRIRDDDIIPVGMWRGEFWGKWTISASRIARYKNDAQLKEFLHQAALNLIATADEDGYIGTYKNPETVFPCDPEVAKKVVGWSSEWCWNIWCRKYTLWGLLEIYELTEDEKILAAAKKATDQLIDMLKRLHAHTRETGTFFGLPSGSILKPVLILYRHTGEQKFLDFALEIANDWDDPAGTCPNIIANSFSGRPLHEWYPDKNWTKAYEMMSCMDGVLELYRVTGVERYLQAAEKFWELLVKYEYNQVLSVGFNDQFEHAAECINSISEPCDVVHWMRLCSELFKLTGEAKYMDKFERAFYNPMLASAFYDGKWGSRGVRSAGRHMVAQGQANMKYSHCCVNNMPRGILNGFESYVMYNGDTILINLYTEMTARLPLAGGEAEVILAGTYLRDGKVTVTVKTAAPAVVRLRIPDWSKKTLVNGTEYENAGQYLEMPVTAGETVISLAFDMTPILNEFPEKPVYFPDAHRHSKRFWDSLNGVDPAIMTWDRRATILYGALLLTRSKLVGNTEEEMFSSDTICGKNVSVKVEPMDSEIVRNAFRVTVAGDMNFTTTMCDYATGTNRWSADDAKLFQIFM